MLKLKKPEFAVLIASVLFGFTAILTKMLIDAFTPIAVLSFRFLFLVITFPLILHALKKISFKELFSITKSEFLTLLLLSFFLAADMVLFFQSFYFIDVSKALFLFLTYPIISSVMASIFLKERITRTDIVATFISMIGIFLIFWKNFNIDFYSFKGEIMVLASALLWSGYLVMNRYSSNINHYRKTFWIFFLNSAMTFPLFIIYGRPSSFLEIKAHHIFLLLVLSVFSTLIPYIIMSYTAKDVKSSTSSIILLIGPIIGVVLSFIILKEKTPFNVIIGGVFVAVSAVISTYSVEKLFFDSKHFAKKIILMLLD